MLRYLIVDILLPLLVFALLRSLFRGLFQTGRNVTRQDGHPAPPSRPNAAVRGARVGPLCCSRQEAQCGRGRGVDERSRVRTLHASTGASVVAGRQNPERFPKDLVFQLIAEEADSLRSQIVTSNPSFACLAQSSPPIAQRSHSPDSHLAR